MSQQFQFWELGVSLHNTHKHNIGEQLIKQEHLYSIGSTVGLRLFGVSMLPHSWIATNRITTEKR
jgi:Mn2+/Fe2+ NRAMP family transporter